MFQTQHSMRWYGPKDAVSLRDIRQAGCTGVVTALHQFPLGEIWPLEAIQERKKTIEDASLIWNVVESLPVHEDIKSQTGNFQQYIDNYIESLKNLSACDVNIITYNFMPVLDWLRTDTSYQLPDQSEALFFRKADYAVFDLFLLKRPNAEKDYTAEELQNHNAYFESMDASYKANIFQNILLGLPGSDDSFTAELILDLLQQYENIDAQQLQSNLIHFLKAIVPTTDALGMKMAIHPDDPPYPVLGLPRIMSTDQDIENVMQAVTNPSNGLCFCTGSFGARPDNDLIPMIKKWSDRIHFLHLRNTKRDEEGNFMEANHLEGDTDMFAIMSEVVEIMNIQNRSIPMRPDHGHKMLDDLSKTTYAWYSAIGRLRGLAELRGLEYAIQKASR